MSFWVYILASGRNGTLYTGSTDDLSRRVGEHRSKAIRGFTATYGVTALVWFEEHPSRASAFERERRIKKWNREWKLKLIERMNPGWRDLIYDFTGTTPDLEGQATRFLRSLDQGAGEDEKSLDPRLRGDERN